MTCTDTTIFLVLYRYCCRKPRVIAGPPKEIAGWHRPTKVRSTSPANRIAPRGKHLGFLPVTSSTWPAHARRQTTKGRVKVWSAALVLVDVFRDFFADREWSEEAKQNHAERQEAAFAIEAPTGTEEVA